MRLLQGKIQNRNKERKLEEFMERKRLEWKFQTPHFGGAHESLVRSTKLVLYRALKEATIVKDQDDVGLAFSIR